MAQNKYKGIIQNSFLYSIGIIASKCVAVILVPIYTHFMSPDEMGITSIISTFIATMDIVVCFCLKAAVVRFYNDYKTDRSALKRFLGTNITFVLCSGVVFTVLLILLRQLYCPFVFKGIDFYPYVLIGIFTLLFDSVYFMYQAFLQAEQNGKAYSINSIIYMLCNAALNIVFVIVLRMGAVGMLLALLIANVIFAVYGLWSMLKKDLMRFVIDRSMLIKFLKYSIPLIPHDLSNSITGFVSQLFLNVSATTKAVGLFSISVRLCSVMDMVQASINLAFRPWFYEQIEKGEEGRRSIVNFADLAFSASCFLCLGMSLFSQEVLILFTEKSYHLAWQIMPIMCLAFSIKFIYYIHVVAMMYSLRGSKFAFICSLFGCFISVFAGYFMINGWLSYGAAAAQLLSSIGLALITILLSRRFIKVGYHLGKMLFKILLVALLGFGGLFFSYIYCPLTVNFLNLLFKLAVFAVGTYILFAGNWKTVWNIVINYIRKIKSKKSA